MTCYDIENTDDARPFDEIEAEYKNIMVRVTPDQTLSKVVERLNEIKAED